MESRHQQPQLGEDPRRLRRLRLPLFDRLVPGEAAGAGSPPDVEPGIAEAIESVRRDIERLLNTRARPESDLGRIGQLTTIDYGLPDFAPLSSANPADQTLFSASIVRRIEAFEPRLRNVRLALFPSAAGPHRVTGVLTADVLIGYLADRVSFELSGVEGGMVVRCDPPAPEKR